MNSEMCERRVELSTSEKRRPSVDLDHELLSCALGHCWDAYSIIVPARAATNFVRTTAHNGADTLFIRLARTH